MYIISFTNNYNFHKSKSDKSIKNKTIIEEIEFFKYEQKDFCEKPNKYMNKRYEKEIDLFKVKFNGINYQMYLYNSPNFLRNEIIKSGYFEYSIGINMIEALKFYSLKKNIINSKDIFILDIGGNVGWYPSLLGRYNYSILSFESLEKNNYVGKKNYCYLNKNSNVIIIPYGLGNEAKICHYFSHIYKGGNGMIKCGRNNTIINKKLQNVFYEVGKVEIKTLKHFIPFLANKNIALIKIDVEGHELKVLEGGLELITKFHVPFIVLEFTPHGLIEHGSKPRNLIELFVCNDYKISMKGFLSQAYINMEQLLSIGDVQNNIYFIHKSILNY